MKVRNAHLTFRLDMQNIRFMQNLQLQLMHCADAALYEVKLQWKKGKPGI